MPLRFDGWRPRVVHAVLAVVLLLPLACMLGPQHAWEDRHGPVVPHDTFPADCSMCHESGSWHRLRAGFTFDHGERTGVPLRGAHANAKCLRCHNDRGPVARFAQRGCAGCHEDVHRGQLGKRCESCHDEQRDWRPSAAIADHRATRFPLVGAHASTACFRCHPGAEVGNFVRADTRCESCHQSDLARAQNPDHAAQGWTSRCDQCHVPISWAPSRFAHATFPLAGVHRTISCASCHVGNQFRGIARECVACHRAEYDRTSEPPHAAAGFSTACETCHTANGFRGATFVHALYPLTGAHRAASCTSCHAQRVYRGTPSACVDCHRAAYDATTNPNHGAAKFPTSCETCHSTSMFRGARFDHRFPISSGDHRGLDCASCHTTANNYRAFSCIDCHEHRKSAMDDEHNQVTGYAWSSPACLQCHPNGRER